jgi:hypothetical protein
MGQGTAGNNRAGHCAGTWKSTDMQITKRFSWEITLLLLLLLLLLLVTCESKGDTSYNRGNRNHFKITQTLPEQHTRKARN